MRRGFRFLVNTLAGLCVIAAVTALGHFTQLETTSASCLYLIAVTLLSLSGDFPAAAIASLASFACLDFFFVPPLYTFRVADPRDTVSLAASLLTALVITRLVSKVRAEAEDARAQRGRLEHLYRLAQQLLAFEPSGPETDFLEAFLGVFGMTAVSVFNAETAELRTLGTSRAGLPGKTRDAYILSIDKDDPKTGVSVRRLQAGGKVTGSIGFEGLAEPAFTAGPLTALAITLIARAQALRKAAESAAATQVEVYRAAVLDALAHEFKTPLATILAAAGALREAGPLQPVQAEMAETVESEAARLGSLTSRLLRTARLDTQEIRPRIDQVDLASIVGNVVSQYSNRSKDRRIVFVPPEESIEALADPDLLRLPLSQLIENACKYSMPGSQVTISMERSGDFALLRVSNNGSSIPANERQRIFDRFYRGADALRSTSGTGLGLYVARKIALAHGGALELENADNGVTFCLKIPCTKENMNHAVTAQ